MELQSFQSMDLGYSSLLMLASVLAVTD